MITGQLLLQTWEAGLRQHPVDRALTVLAAGFPETSWETLAGLSVGARDAALLRLRRQSFGAHLRGMDNCPACGEQLEFVMNVADITVEPASFGPAEIGTLVCDGYELQFRLPTSSDLASITGCTDVAAARRQLVERCVCRASHQDLPGHAVDLPKEIIGRLAAKLVECDPQAEVLLDLTCPFCGQNWQSLFDIEVFLWTELCAQAKRLLRDVHTLARAYGWSERDILSMSSARRNMYLEMVSNG